MQNTHKGYILPMALIVILLGLAGVFLFTGQDADAPVAADDTPVRATSTQVVSNPATRDDSATTTDTDDEPVATSTTSTTTDISAGLE